MTHAVGESARPKVLFVDDEENWGELARTYLDEMGAFDVELESFAPRALDRIRNGDFDVIVSDYMMPSMNGIELLRSLREMGINTPFILFTGRDREEVSLEAMNSGAEFFLQKGGNIEIQFTELSNMIVRSVSRMRVEERLTYSEERYRQLVESANSIIMERDLEGRIVFMNNFGLRFFGYSMEELYGSNVVGTIVPLTDSTGRDMRSLIREISEDPESFDRNENENVLRDGSIVWVSWTNKALLDERGETTGILAVGNDITERKGAEMALIESERKIRDLLDSSVDGFIAINYDRKIIEFNKSAQRITGLTREQVLGKTLVEAFSWMDAVFEQEMVDQVLEDRGYLETEVQVDMGEGTRWFEVRAIPQEERVMVYFWSIDDRKARERDLRKSEEMYRMMFETAANLIISVDSTGKLIDCNSRSEEVVGYSKEELIGQNITLIMHPDSLDKAWDCLSKLKDRGTTYNTEYRMIRKDGEIIEVSINSSALLDSEGDFERTICFIRDVTEKRRGERAVRKSEATFRGLFENTRVGIGISDAGWGDLRINPAVTSILGYSEEDLRTIRDISTIVHPDDVDRDGYSDMLEGRTDHFTQDMRFRRSDDEFVWVRMTISAVRDENGNPEMMIYILEDINDQKTAEQRLRDSEMKYRKIIDEYSDGILLSDLEGNIVESNQAFSDLTGYSFEELQGLNLEKLPPSDKLDFAWNEFRFALETGRHSILDGTLISRRGDPISVDISAVVLGIGGERYMALIFKDIRERKRMMDALEVVNQKLNLVGSITRHDLLNQLTTLLGHLEIAKTLDSKQDILARMERSISAGDNIIRILDFGREYESVGTKDPDWISISEAFQNGISTLDMENIEVNSKCDGLRVYSDPMLQKVFHNLVDDTIRHSKGAKEIRLFYEMGHEGLKLVYADDGRGISYEDKQRLFRGELAHGLFLVRDILAITGMTIEENGTPGVGARFEILVPQERYRFS